MELIKKYFPDLTTSQLANFELLKPNYKIWNDQINVISRKDMDNFYLHHVLHSLAISKFITFKDNSTVLDLGTGGGFPGIPLAILFPNVNFVLADSIQKKIKVVNEIKNILKLDNVTAIAERGENLKIKPDYIVSRAVTRLLPFYEFIKEYFPAGKEKGLFYLKGGDLHEEINELLGDQKKLKGNIHAIDEVMNEDFFETKKVVHIWK